MIITPFDKMQMSRRVSARARIRRQIKLFRRYASRAQKSGRGKTRAEGRAKDAGREGEGEAGDDRRRKKKEDQG